jgi:hypothetical protein
MRDRQLALFSRLGRGHAPQAAVERLTDSAMRLAREAELLERFRELADEDQDALFRYMYRLLGRPKAVPPWASTGLKRTWAVMTRLTPVQFVDFCALLLCAQGYKYHVDHRRAADEGVSLLLTKRRARHIVICKPRTVKNVGLTTVRELAELMQRRGVSRGMIVTNAGFTEEARAERDQLLAARRNWQIALIDSRRIHGWLEQPKFGQAREFLASPRSEAWPQVLKGYGKRLRRRRR